MAVASRKRNGLSLLVETFERMDEHSVLSQSASLAYYSVFSIAPILIAVITVAGRFFGADAVRGEIVNQLQGLMGAEAAQAIQTLLQKAARPGHGATLANVIGLATLLIGATAVFVELQEALNRIWDVKPRSGSLIGSLLRKRFVSFGLVLGIGFLLLVSLVVSAGLAAATGFLRARLPLPPIAVEVCNTTLTFALLAILVALFYKILPDARIEWGDVALGAVVTAALFSLGKWLIGLYIGRAAIISPYGAAGSLVVILVWVYYASFILLFGAELTRSYTRLYRTTRVEPEPGAVVAKTKAV
jgi:membrane protein